MPDNNDKMYDYAKSVMTSFGNYYNRIQTTYASTRLRYNPAKPVAGLDLTVAPTARALATVTQFVSLADSIPHATVLPKDNTETEDKKTDKLERFLSGVPRAIPYVGMHPYDQYLHNFAEAGIGYLLLDVDEGRAIEGKFPFVITAPSPESVAFAFNKTQMLCCVIKETQEVGGLYRELKTRYDAAKEIDGKKKWSIPEGLEQDADDDPMRMIEVMYLYTCDKQYMWVQDKRVWDRDNWLKVVPLALGLCTPLPSSKPEEYGLGMVYAALKMMNNEEKMMSKAYTGFEFYTFPQATVTYADGTIEVVQAKPGMRFTDAVKVEYNTPQPNYQSMELLSQQADVAIGRVSLQEQNFGDQAGAASGYQVSLLQEAPMRRVDKQIEYAAKGMADHFVMLLKGVELLATEEAAKVMGITGEEKVQQYLSSFSTVHHPPENPDQKARARVTLSKQDVVGYTEIEVSLKPELPQDENAKYNRAQLAKETGMSNEGVFRNVLKVANPDQEFAWQREDMLKNDPMWQEFLLRKAQKDVLERDEKLKAEFVEFIEAKKAAMAAQPPPAPESPVDPMQDPNTQGDPSLMDAQGNLPLDMNGFSPDQLPPAAMGMTPSNPIDNMLAQQMQGGVQGI